MEVTSAQVEASVQGSRTRPYGALIETDVLTESERDAIEAVMAPRAGFAARCLADGMPEEIGAASLAFDGESAE